MKETCLEMLAWCEAGFVNYMKKESYIFEVFVPLFLHLI